MQVCIYLLFILYIMAKRIKQFFLQFIVLFIHWACADVGPYKKVIISMHNNYRSAEMSSDMKFMKWNTDLEREARLWVEECFFDHQLAGHGENMYFSTGKKQENVLIRDALRAWHRERKNYKYGRDCGNACHYTQMVWAKSSEIGCASKRCSMLFTVDNVYNESWFFVCFYESQGNIVGSFPFQKGDACTRCEKGEQCNGKLCHTLQNHYKAGPDHWSVSQWKEFQQRQQSQGQKQLQQNIQKQFLGGKNSTNNALLQGTTGPTNEQRAAMTFPTEPAWGIELHTTKTHRTSPPIKTTTQRPTTPEIPEPPDIPMWSFNLGLPTPPTPPTQYPTPGSPHFSDIAPSPPYPGSNPLPPGHHDTSNFSPSNGQPSYPANYPPPLHLIGSPPPTPPSPPGAPAIVQQANPVPPSNVAVSSPVQAHLPPIAQMHHPAVIHMQAPTQMHMQAVVPVQVHLPASAHTQVPEAPHIPAQASIPTPVPASAPKPAVFPNLTPKDTKETNSWPSAISATHIVQANPNIKPGHPNFPSQPAQPVQQQSIPVQTQPVHQPVNQPVHQPVNQQAHQPVNQPAHQPVNQPAHQPVNQPVHQPVNQPLQQAAESQPAPQYQQIQPQTVLQHQHAQPQAVPQYQPVQPQAVPQYQPVQPQLVPQHQSGYPQQMPQNQQQPPAHQPVQSHPAPQNHMQPHAVVYPQSPQHLGVQTQPVQPQQYPSQQVQYPGYQQQTVNQAAQLHPQQYPGYQPPQPTQPPAPCIDKDINCKHWKMYCLNNGYVRNNCQVTCTTCPGQGAATVPPPPMMGAEMPDVPIRMGHFCKDHNPKCPHWMSYCAMGDHIEDMCPKTCRVCLV
ncbi:hypothetical protein CHS0354_016446 [Potamilus streckersoni]|uniref:ShKT domain-containing protein n=1 Tax=Potamilus streckersoni TaxID=2493646 RepID=A0AAE0TJH5_9BIVA|nr:hypothetical protein CHS0354_016446 [Potamilus streckersoni]